MKQLGNKSLIQSTPPYGHLYKWIPPYRRRFTCPKDTKIRIIRSSVIRKSLNTALFPVPSVCVLYHLCKRTPSYADNGTMVKTSHMIALVSGPLLQPNKYIKEVGFKCRLTLTEHLSGLLQLEIHLGPPQTRHLVVDNYR